jgi:hypothetical protein
MICRSIYLRRKAVVEKSERSEGDEEESEAGSEDGGQIYRYLYFYLPTFYIFLLPI